MTPRTWPWTPAPLKAGLRPGLSALMWHRLQHERTQAGQPIVCVSCRRVHEAPPQYGGCACGSYRFEVAAAPPVAVGG